MSTHLWVGSLDHGDHPGLSRFDVSDTHLRLIDSLPMTNVGWLVDAGSVVWADLHTEDSALVAIGTDPFVAGESVHTGDSDACHLALTPSGEWAALVHYTSGSVAIFGVAAHSGGDTPPTPRLVTQLRFSGHSGVHERQTAPRAHHAQWLRDDLLLVCDLGADRVRVLTWDEQRLVELEPIVTPPGFGPRHLVVRHRGDEVQLAVAGELSGQVASYVIGAHELPHGSWRQVSVVDGTLIGGSAPSGLRALGDDQLVMANRFINTLAFLRWNGDASLELLDEIDSGGDHARDLVLHEGRLWVAHQHSSDLTVFEESSKGWRIIDRIETANPAAILFRQA